MIYLHTKFHILISNDLFIIAIKRKAKHRICASVILFYVTRKNYLKKKLNIFSKSVTT
jgi:hypothetical protein